MSFDPAVRVCGAPSWLRRAFVLAGMLAVTACATAPSPQDWSAPTGLYGASSQARAARPAASSGHQKIGRPYQINGTWYVPAREDDYDETGVASWYGPNFHGRPTANGETFDQNLMTAAHTTLPLPSLVRVRNLENGRSVVVRVNDRGPFANDRIIDMSRAAARELGFERQGTARVRVQYLGPAEAGVLAANAPASQGGYRERSPGVYEPAPSRRSGRSEPSRSVYVQVASFRDRERAINLMRRLGAGGPVFVSRVEISGVVWHRVMIGPWPSERGARAARREVSRMGFSDARIVNAN